jgi:hypothetical protein
MEWLDPLKHHADFSKILAGLIRAEFKGSHFPGKMKAEQAFHRTIGTMTPCESKPAAAFYF